MGTNYYIAVDHCSHCGRFTQDDEPGAHIGKSSHGWAFGLHVARPGEAGPQSLDDWLPILRAGPIVDEYGHALTAEEMLFVIKERYFKQRHDVDGVYCVGHGPGSWDLLVGRFC